MRLIARDRWLVELLNPDAALDVHERFCGEAVRTDGWSCRGRSVHWHLIYLAIDGRSIGRTSDGVDISIEPGQALWMPPYTNHAFDWTPTFRYDEIWFTLVRDEPLTPIASPLRLDAAGETRPLFDRLADELGVHRPLREQGLRCLLAMLSVALFRLESSPSVSGQGLSAGQRDRIVRYTQTHLTDGVTPSDLAAEVELTSDYFARQFRASFGCSPRTWLARERIRAASRLLSNSNLRVFQIATQLGYADVPQFSRQFKKMTGANPEDFRRTAPLSPPKNMNEGGGESNDARPTRPNCQIV
jgi:AraC-like DNA-binding protein